MEFDIYSMSILGLGLSIPFSLWWLYFDSVDGAPIRAVTRKGQDWPVPPFGYTDTFPLLLQSHRLGLD